MLNAGTSLEATLEGGFEALLPKLASVCQWRAQAFAPGENGAKLETCPSPGDRARV